MAKISTSTEVSAVTLTPLARVVRTVLQTVLAFGASFPTLIALVHLTAAQTAEYSSIVAGLVLVASTVQNLLEHFNVIPTTGAKAASTSITK
jgi:uncharacterized membrane protein